MNAVDFEYDGQYLSDYGFIICDFDERSGVDTVSAGSVITFNKVSLNSGKKHSLTSTKYDECLTTIFDICKNPEIYSPDEMEITIDECRELMRWLNRRQFLKFQIYDKDRDLETCYYDVSFNIEKIKISERVYGLRLTMETNRPFGYGMEQETTLSFEAEEEKVFVDFSDEIGVLYPKIQITCKDDGDLHVYNNLFDSEMVIKNCTNGEKIFIDTEHQIIYSSIVDRKIFNDFNYEFLKIGNTLHDRRNKIHASMACDIIITYTPIIKESP